MGVWQLLGQTFRRSDFSYDGNCHAMETKLRSRAGATRGGPAAGEAAAAEEVAAKLPRNFQEMAALIRDNGYTVLSQDKFRKKHGTARGGSQCSQGAAAEHQQAGTAPARRGAEKRKHAELSDASASDHEQPARTAFAGAAQQPPAAQQQQQQQQQHTAALKRMRSVWKMRPLLIDEKLPIFIEGQDEEALQHYDEGEFQQWLADCAAGKADPADGFPYPLIVQDKDMRTLLELKPPEQQASEQQAASAQVQAVETAADKIIVPTVRVLPAAQQPDLLVREHQPPVVHRIQPPEQPDVAGTSAAALAASAAWRSAERAVALDPPYIRYVQPTPDDLDLAVEYDLDEDDEEWLAQYNLEAKRAKSRKGRRVLAEEWMEHLIDRMEKEYTAELQKHPGKWVVHGSEPGGGEQAPNISIPSIDEMFPLEKCLQVPGINHYENVITAVYGYWKAKHERAGRPLIQRLWYEPPWDRKKAAQRLASSAADGEGGDDGPFHAQDSPVALAGIRKRRLDPEEVKNRFQEIRRDLEASRTLADQIRKREKLKRRELQLYKEEWAARMQAIQDGMLRVVLRTGSIKDPPAQLSAVWRMQAAGTAAAPASSGEAEVEAVGAPQDAAAQAEERAARLAMRRFARDVAGLGIAPRQPPPQQQQQRQTGRPRPRPPAAAAPVRHRKTERQPSDAVARPASRAAGGGGGILSQGGNVRGPPAAPGVRRDPHCVWCSSDAFLMLGCAACPRCFCFKCFQRRSGLGINNWSRAVKDPHYTCIFCRGLEAEDAPSANTARQLPVADAAEATLSPGHRMAQQTQRRPQHQQRQQAEGAELEGVPRGLGGAALRSFLQRRQRNEAVPATFQQHDEESGESLDPPQHPQHQSHRSARLRRHRGQPGSSSDPGEVDEEGRRHPRPRKLGGAALASHLRRLEARRQHRQQQQQQQQRPRHSEALPAEEQQAQGDHSGGSSGEGEAEEAAGGWPYSHIPAPARRLVGAALKSYIKRQEQLLEEQQAGSDSEQPSSSGQLGTRTGAGPDDWPFAHIPPPSRRLVGAALHSYIKRQEQLLEQEGQQEGSPGSDSEQPSSSQGAPAAAAAVEGPGWPHRHIPAPSRKLGGAALKSYIRRQEQLLEGRQGGNEPSGSSSGTAEEWSASGTDHDVASGPADRHHSSGEEHEHEHYDHKENKAPAVKRARPLVGAALAAHLRKQQGLPPASLGGRRQAHESAAGTRRAGSRRA